jgi:Xaa-Pro dipeptidase
MTRVLEPGMVVTIEPGLYFIDMLLEELRAKPVANDIDWNKVDAFRPYGGIRIEDDVVCTDGAPENLTRDAFAAQT